MGSSPIRVAISADLAHLVERHLAKVEVASSSLVIRSTALAIVGAKAFIFVKMFAFYKSKSDGAIAKW